MGATKTTRRKLAMFSGGRFTYTAEFERYGSANGWKGRQDITILLRDVYHGDEFLTDHIWIKESSGFKALGTLQPGDTVKFNARATQYEKGYKGCRLDLLVERPLQIDWRLSFPTQVYLIAE